jgi:hypothetical protein
MEIYHTILANSGNIVNHIVFIVFGLCGMTGMFIKMWSELETHETALKTFLFGNIKNVVKALLYFFTAWMTLAASGTIAAQTDLSSVIILAVGSGAAVARDFKKTNSEVILSTVEYIKPEPDKKEVGNG